jgi:small subunit ribosomal protein S6
MLRRYEVVVVFDADLGEEAISQQVEKIEALLASHGGAVETKDVWGHRALAYTIKKKQYGIYVLLVVSGEGTLVADLRRQLRINDAVLRFFVAKKDKYAPDLVQRVRDENMPGDQAFADDRREAELGFSDDVGTDEVGA